VYHPDNIKGGPVTLFFNFDHLILLSIWLGGHAVESAMLLSLITLIATLIFGRVFCGWISPFGAMHNLFTSMSGRKRRIE